MDRIQQINALYKELASSPDRTLVKVLNVFEIPRYFFSKSYEDFMREANEMLKTPEFEIKRLCSEPKYFMELTRLFYNYCSSAALLIDTTRVFISDLKKNDVILDKNKLDNEKKARFENSICNAIKIFRNLFSHVQSPLFTISYYPGKNEANITFRKDNPLVLDRKDKGAEELFNLMDEPIDICRLAEDYRNIINDFHRWLDNEVKSLIKERILIREEKRQKWITLTNAELIDDFIKKKGKSDFDIGKRIIESYDTPIQENYKLLVAKREVTQQIAFLIGILISFKVIELSQTDKLRQLLIRFYT